MTRLRTTAVLAAAAAAAAAAFAAVPAADAGTRTVQIKGLAFTPAKVTVRRGDTVTWRFLDKGVQHDVTARGFKSSRLKSSGTHRVRFSRRGTFSYGCTVHGTMRGRVVVR